MNLKEIRQLATWMGEAGLSALEIKRADFKLFIRRCPSAFGVKQALEASVIGADPIPQSSGNTQVVKAGNPGVFFATHPEERNSYAKPGDAVITGQLLGVLKVGGLYLPVRSDGPGKVLQLLAAEGQQVGYGQALVELEEAEHAH